ncbi:hypothetical protein BH11MYX3_BH11MYX3_34610 [soil metagenome]
MDVGLLGGVLIGAASSLLLVTHGRIAGINGILGSALSAGRRGRACRLAFLGGLALTGLVAAVAAPRAVASPAAEIDVQATLAKKLDVTTRPYLILGACNPELAHRALQIDPGIGTLLPCNVVVVEDEEGKVSVAAIDPVAMFAVVENPALTPIVEDVRARLQRALAGLDH